VSPAFIAVTPLPARTLADDFTVTFVPSCVAVIASRPGMLLTVPTLDAASAGDDAAFEKAREVLALHEPTARALREHLLALVGG